MAMLLLRLPPLRLAMMMIGRMILVMRSGRRRQDGGKARTTATTNETLKARYVMWRRHQLTRRDAFAEIAPAPTCCARSFVVFVAARWVALEILCLSRLRRSLNEQTPSDSSLSPAC
jgi:hypothetical protein